MNIFWPWELPQASSYVTHDTRSLDLFGKAANDKIIDERIRRLEARVAELESANRPTNTPEK